MPLLYNSFVICFFYGENDFELNRAVAKLRGEFIRENGAEAVAKFDASETESDKVFAEIINVNLFAPRRFFVIKNVFANKLFAEKLPEFLSRIPDENDVILTDAKPDKRTKIFKDLIAKTTAREFKILREWELKKWLAGEVNSRKIIMKNEAQDELLDLLSGEENPQNRAAQELDKFANLGSEITLKKVREIVEPNLASNAFEIFNLALRGKHKKCAQELAKLRDSREDANRFLGLLASQIFALMAVVFDDGKTDLAKELKIHPFQLQKSRDVARSLGDKNQQKSRVKQLAKILAEIDAKMKLSRSDEAWTLVEIALAKI